MYIRYGERKISQKPSNITKISGLSFRDWEGDIGEAISEEISPSASVF